MFNRLRQWLSPKAQVALVEERMDIEQRLFRTIAEQQKCPDCGDKPVKLFAGPEGGMSTNVFCSNCGHGYNITPVIRRAEDIGVNLDYCQNEQIKARRALEKRYA